MAYRSYLKSLIQKAVGKTTWRKRDKSKRVLCPHPDYLDACIILPPEWLGSHIRRRDEVVSAIGKQGAAELYNLAIALAIADGWENIPGIEGEDPVEWDLEKTPVQLISWIGETVLEDFARSFEVPKNSFQLSESGLTAIAEEPGSTQEIE